jgi:hypothetical protein
MTEGPRMPNSVILQKNYPTQWKIVEHYSSVKNG